VTIVDQGCSKAAKFIPCHKTIDGPGVAHEYLKHLVPWFGIPKRIISDRDPRFTSHFSKTLCNSLGVNQNLSTAFHPQTDGQTERMNAWVEQYLRAWTTGRQNNWAKMLPVAEYAHNSWKHDVTRRSPHELLIGIKPQVHVKFLPENVPASADRIRLLEDTRKEVQTLLERHQQQKNPRKLTEMKVGEQVWLEGKNLHVKGTRKLLPKRYGPYKIKDKIGTVAYRLDLPPSMKIHDVFHVNLLFPYKETEAYGPAYTRPPPELIGNEEEYEVEFIRDARRKRRGQGLQYLVHWKNYPNSDDSWVDHKDLHAPELLKELLRPLSYLGAARPLMLPLFRLLPYLYLPDRSTAYTGLTSAVAAISMLSSYRPNTSTSVRTMPTFLFRLAFPRLSNHSLASCYESSPVFLVRVSQFFGYLLRLFCYLLSTILRISQPISKLLTHPLTVL
jgi:hypothetical protein